MDSVAFQITKLIVGLVLALACLAFLAVLMLNDKPVEPQLALMLIGGIVVGGGGAVHGAFKTPTKQDPPPPGG